MALRHTRAVTKYHDASCMNIKVLFFCVRERPENFGICSYAMRLKRQEKYAQEHDFMRTNASHEDRNKHLY